MKTVHNPYLNTKLFMNTHCHGSPGNNKISKKRSLTNNLKTSYSLVQDVPVITVEQIENDGDHSPTRKNTKIKLPIHSIIRTMTLPQPVAAKKLGVSISTL